MRKVYNTERSRSGFTLIELLITISIIAILSAIGLVVFSGVAREGRDSKRQSDLRTIQSALEQYNSDQGFYPLTNNYVLIKGLDTLLSQVSPTTPQTFTSNTGNLSQSSSPKIYLNSLPQDPKVSPRYEYVAIPANCTNNVSNTCTSYCLYAVLENVPYPIPSPPSGCTYPSGYNFAVTSQ